MTDSNSNKILRVGIIGAGEVAQVIHLPTLSLLTHLFQVTIICDVSSKTAEHSRKKYHIAEATTSAERVLTHPDVDVVFNLTSDQYHAPYTILALENDKDVMLEKPLTLSMGAALAIVEAEKNSKGRVFVGTMRRYAPSFTRAFKREVDAIPRILYARSRGIVGPNAFFVEQSGTFQVRFQDDVPDSARRDAKVRMNELLSEALGGYEGEMSTERINLLRFLGSLGSHDLSLMRETLGTPESVSGISVHDPFYSAILDYTCAKSGRSFSCTYESGIDNVPRFDSSLTVYGDDRTVSISYDTPYVKAQAITVRVDELVDGERVVREVISSLEDAYTAEMREVYECFARGKLVKTSAVDSLEDLKIWQMMLKEYDEVVRRRERKKL